MKKLFESLAFRLGLAIAAIVVVAFMSLVYVYQQSIKFEFHEFVSIGGDVPEFSETLEPDEIETLAEAFETGGWDALRNAFPGWLDDGSYVVLEADGRIISSPFGPAEFADFKQVAAGVYQLKIGEGENSQVQLMGVSGTPLVDSEGSIFGHILFVPMPPNLQPETFAYSVSRAAAGFVILIVMVTLLLVGFSVRSALRPVHQLTRAARKLQAGQIPGPVDSKVSGEVGDLVMAFNSAVRELAHTEDMRKKIISDVAHELRTPVTNLKGQLEALEAGLIKKDKDFLKVMQTETGLLEGLIEDLQELAISDAGRLKVYPEPLNLARELDEAWKGFHGAKSAKFVIRVPKTMEVDADPRRLRQILLNLFSNALNAKPKGLVLKIEAKAVDKMVEISIIDNGPGIEADDLPYIFQRFYRADQSRTRDTGGAGLGLSIVKTFVEAHGGGVSIKSSKGKGATVSFTLPLSK
ncbi:MAG: HAMP domain-containing histidine kinase [Proteobacteria bacterium]|nr:HAMP domain-containing histidine kinase [Pseudomonadota bacterium]